MNNDSFDQRYPDEYDLVQWPEQVRIRQILPYHILYYIVWVKPELKMFFSRRQEKRTMKVHLKMILKNRNHLKLEWVPEVKRVLLVNDRKNAR